MEAMNTVPRYRRRQYLVRTKFQLSYVGLILALIIFTACVCSYTVYYTSLITLGDKLAAVYPQGRLVSIVNTVNSRILLNIILITPFIIIIGIYFSHKIAGPIYRMERFLKEMAAGNLSERLILRKGDELAGIADGINDIGSSFISLIDSQKDKLDALSGEMEELKNSLPADIKEKGNIAGILNAINNQTAALRAGLDKYKLRK